MTSFSTMAERANATARFTLAYGFIFLLFVFNIVAVSYPLPSAVKAPLFLMVIYYWAIYRPTLLPLWLVFCAGIAMDVLSNLPMGLSALVFVLVHWSVRDQRRFLMGQPFPVIWLGFIVTAGLAGFIQWVLFGLSKLGWTPLDALGLSIALGACIFPFVSVLLHLIHKILPGSDPGTRFSSQTQGRRL